MELKAFLNDFACCLLPIRKWLRVLRRIEPKNTRLILLSFIHFFLPMIKRCSFSSTSINLSEFRVRCAVCYHLVSLRRFKEIQFYNSMKVYCGLYQSCLKHIYISFVWGRVIGFRRWLTWYFGYLLLRAFSQVSKICLCYDGRYGWTREGCEPFNDIQCECFENSNMCNELNSIKYI